MKGTIVFEGYSAEAPHSLAFIAISVLEAKTITLFIYA
jgi:hypothetical protein